MDDLLQVSCYSQETSTSAEAIILIIGHQPATYADVVASGARYSLRVTGDLMRASHCSLGMNQARGMIGGQSQRDHR